MNAKTISRFICIFVLILTVFVCISGEQRARTKRWVVAENCGFSAVGAYEWG